ncbi:uncharacterized protein A1O9_06067 [Exophiala aquamarina CBS 119918]|uniref:MINDY deubiquitinase domain-containing protein n=1 Tax=Exophiala aquamarina CBS 119918 TaxID=1182545 RepID=A0A072PFT9_9EURO|nr:uncharacterized protein A1O9_06067 [Exophiala aquamarina CBS 119918]KEF58143.1 hypothetical protein A1O9_06067 [Exophiala aquamarina CBS 119918]
MVTRKSSLPYSNSPPEQPVYANYNPSHEDNLIPDAAAIPPVPHPARRSPQFQNNNAPFDTADNPWSDAPHRDLRSDRPLPDFLKAGSRTPENGPPTPSLANIPNILRAGQSGEDTPRSSLDSQRSKDFWDDSDDDRPGKKTTSKSPRRSPKKPTLPNVEAPAKSPGIKRKPVAVSPQHSRSDLTSPVGFASNNPFRRPSEGTVVPDLSQDGNPTSKGKAPVRDSPKSPPVPYGSPAPHMGSRTGPETSYNTFQHGQPETEAWANQPHSLPPMPSGSPPPPPPPDAAPLSPFSKQAPLIPLEPQKTSSSENPWTNSAPPIAATPSPIPFPPSQKQVSAYNRDLLDRGQQTGVVSLQDELSTLPNAVETGPVTRPEPSLLDDDNDVGPPLPVRPVQRTETEFFEPPEGPPPPKPPRPALKTTAPSEQEIAKLLEQRNETYQVKHFNWFDHSSRRLRASSMLTQNRNGPCPLLALVNALILGAGDESQPALDEALRSREQVTLGLIIETLMDELLSRGLESVGDMLPDVDELNAFLLRLRTGMNANPRFVPPTIPAPNLMDDDGSMLNIPQQQRAQYKSGTFEATTDMKLYGAFTVPLIHGWLPEPGSDAAKAFARSAQTYEDAQALQFGEEELEYKLSNFSLSPEEQNLLQDITSIKNFFKTYPTQLSPTGLEAVQDSIPSGSFAIMFRNDHFSTIYKHPENGQLFTLITDAGYADRDEIIWESLVDINGKHSEFFSGDFMPVSHNGSADESNTHPARRSSLLLSVNTPSNANAPLSPQEQQEQHDADFAMALQLQEEEEQRQRAERNRRRSGANQTSGSATTNTSSSNNNRRSGGNIPIPLPSRPQAEVRPSIPPRTSRNPNPAVNRPSDADADDAPPAYEEAAKGRPYIPPLGSPLHPSSDPSPMNSNLQLTGTISNNSGSSALDSHPPGPNVAMGRRQPGRRMSAYNEQAQYYNAPQRPHGLNVAQGVGPSGPSRPNRQDRDCVVM